LSRLIDDPELRQKMGHHAKALVEDRFDALKNSTQIVDVLLEMIRGNRNGQSST
jgi:glycosyltransferase involved in cell wall biosynthesis